MKASNCARPTTGSAMATGISINKRRVRAAVYVIVRYDLEGKRSIKPKAHAAYCR